MNYIEFKKVIENVEKVDATLYDKLVSHYGKTIINNLFERYINDDEREDNSDKINRTNYYVELREAKNLGEVYQIDMGDLQNLDLINVYFKEIGSFKLFTDVFVIFLL